MKWLILWDEAKEASDSEKKECEDSSTCISLLLAGTGIMNDDLQQKSYMTS